MNILLINSNPVVSRLIALCMREKDTVFEEVEYVGDVALDRYAVVFVDDRSFDVKTKEVLSSIMIQKKVLLSNNGENLEIGLFDEVIKKPFLPSQIRIILQDIEKEENTEQTIENPSIFPLETDSNNIVNETVAVGEEEEIERADDTNVLDSKEIEKIKVLLEMDKAEKLREEVFEEEALEARKVEVIKQQLEADGLEIISEEEYVETLSRKPSKEKKRKKMKSKKSNEKKREKSQKKNKDILVFEEALIEAVKGMKVKKIKKLLKGAEVSIQINFKDKK